jgi:pyruvate formate lyase activating enzyme
LNDSEHEIGELTGWVARELGPEVPLHFTAFHPDFRMRDVPPTPPETLRLARKTAMKAGLQYVYTGNVHDKDGDTTFCPRCRVKLIERDWYEILRYKLTEDGFCPNCGKQIPGRFGEFTKSFGRLRIPVDIQS